MEIHHTVRLKHVHWWKNLIKSDIIPYSFFVCTTKYHPDNTGNTKKHILKQVLLANCFLLDQQNILNRKMSSFLMNFYEIDITDPWDSEGTTLSCRVTPPPPPPPYMSAGEIRLCYIPSLVSSVLITSRHNASCSSSFPRPRRQTWRRKAGVHLKITETRSCHLRAFVIKVLLCSIWFTLGMLIHCVDLGGGADWGTCSRWWIVQCSGCLDSSVHGMAILHGTVT